MREESIEPGLLPVFRLFAGLQAGLYTLEVVPRLFHLAAGLPFEPEPHPEHVEQLIGLFHSAFGLPYGFSYANFFLLPGLVETAALLIYLLAPPLQRALKGLYLPIGLLLAGLGTMALEYGEFYAMARLEPLDMRVLTQSWQVVLLLFIPLVLIGWQYDMRTVVLFSLSTAALDVGARVWLIGLANPYALPLVSIVFVRTAIYIVVGYMITRLMAAQREQRSALARANATLAQYASTLEQLTVSRERNRLARELHDTLAHTLSGMAVELEAVRTLWTADPPQAHKLLDHSLAVTRSGLTETRRALQALRAEPLEDLGLVLAVRHMAESITAQAGLALAWHGPGDRTPVQLSADAEQCVYRVAQEALYNAAKHARARQVTVRWGQQDAILTLEIADDGCGFDPSRVDANTHLGLRGMQERANMAGGRVEVTSAPGHGTTVRLCVGGKRWSGS